MFGRRIQMFLFVAALSCAITKATAAAEWQVDLELVLAVDIWSSVSTEEFERQMGGLANAFRTPEVAAAIRAGDIARHAKPFTMIHELCDPATPPLSV